MKHRFFMVALVAAMPLFGVTALTPGRAHAAKATHTVTTQVSGKFTGTAQSLTGPGTFKGALHITHFAAQNHQLMATATLSGTLKDSTGKTKDISQSVTFPVKGLKSGGKQQSMAAAPQPMAYAGIHLMAPSCTILTLNLGPLHLNLLGLVIDLQPVHLTITGQTGNGNLLGNLLCGIAGLLNGVSLQNLAQMLLQDIVTLLNQALGV